MTSRTVKAHWAVVGVTALLVVLVVTVPSSGATSESAVLDADDPHALDLLNRSATANERVSYTGTRYVTTWTSVRSSNATASAVVKVEHQAGGSTKLSMHDQRDAVSLGASSSHWLAEASSSVELLASAYWVQSSGSGYVAGRLADIVEAVRHDGTVAAVLWLDRATALPLRRETFDVDGRMLSASAFVEVHLTLTDSLECCATAQSTEAEFLAPSDVDDLRSAGWTCPETLPGSFALFDARRVGDVVHFAYSDGVMSLSVSQQAGVLDYARMDEATAEEIHGGTVYVNAGPPARFVWEHDGVVISVITDGPLEAVHSLIKQAAPTSFQPDKSDKGGFLDRLTRGTGKVGSWLNPFD